MTKIEIVRAKTASELASKMSSLLNTGSWSLSAVVVEGGEWIAFVQGSYR